MRAVRGICGGGPAWTTRWLADDADRRARPGRGAGGAGVVGAASASRRWATWWQRRQRPAQRVTLLWTIAPWVILLVLLVVFVLPRVSGWAALASRPPRR